MNKETHYVLLPAEDFHYSAMDAIRDYCGDLGTNFTLEQIDSCMNRLMVDIKWGMIKRLDEQYGKGKGITIYEQKIKGTHLNLFIGNGTWSDVKLVKQYQFTI